MASESHQNSVVSFASSQRELVDAQFRKRRLASHIGMPGSRTTCKILERPVPLRCIDPRSWGSPVSLVPLLEPFGNKFRSGVSVERRAGHGDALKSSRIGHYRGVDAHVVGLVVDGLNDKYIVD